MNQGSLAGIARRAESRAPMEELRQVELTVVEGVAGDFRGRPGDRQVTVLSADDWRQACRDVGRELPWTVRRANLLVEGLTFAGSSFATLRIGDVLLRVTGETDPCHRMDEQVAGLRAALEPDWRGGVCCRVVSGGVIRAGDRVVLEAAPAG